MIITTTPTTNTTSYAMTSQQLGVEGVYDQYHHTHTRETAESSNHPHQTPHSKKRRAEREENRKEARKLKKARKKAHSQTPIAEALAHCDSNKITLDILKTRLKHFGSLQPGGIGYVLTQHSNPICQGFFITKVLKKTIKKDFIVAYEGAGLPKNAPRGSIVLSDNPRLSIVTILCQSTAVFKLPVELDLTRDSAGTNMQNVESLFKLAPDLFKNHVESGTGIVKQFFEHVEEGTVHKLSALLSKNSTAGQTARDAFSEFLSDVLTHYLDTNEPEEYDQPIRAYLENPTQATHREFYMCIVLEARNQHWSKKIRAARRENPNKIIVVVAGSDHFVLNVKKSDGSKVVPLQELLAGPL